MTILAHDPELRWFEVRSASGATGWIVRRYLDGLEQRTPPQQPEASGPSPWSSPEGCQRSLMQNAGVRAKRSSARVGSWNIAWFPDGKPGKRAAQRGTDLSWLACAIATLDVDVLALQEIKTLPRARRAMDHVIAELNRHTDGDWRFEHDGCPMPAAQHNAILYDAQRVQARAFADYGSLNAHAANAPGARSGEAACENLLRPGFGAYLSFRGGLDLHLITVHQKSGTHRRDYDLRQTALRGLSAATTAAEAREPDLDVVIVGDFNTMGCDQCSPTIPASEELGALDRVVRGLARPLQRLAAVPACSEYYRGKAGLLDLFLVSQALTELPDQATAETAGICAELQCGSTGRQRPRALSDLSDHCPLLLTLMDRDLD